MMQGFWIKALSLIILLSPLNAAADPVVHVTEVTGTVPATPTAQIMASLRESRSTGNIRMYNIGRTTQGQTIPMVVMSPVKTDRLPPIRILIICALHGDEPASAFAITEIIRHLSERNDPDLLLGLGVRNRVDLSNLDRVLWLIIPVANPDGFDTGKRGNAAGVDLNRDWVQRTQPETQAIKRVFDRWSPHMVLDLHQWGPKSPPPAENGIEIVSRPNTGAQWELETSIANKSLAHVRNAGHQASLVTSSPRLDPSLSHRYFASRGAVSYLIETAADATSAERRRLLTDLVLVISAKAAQIEPKHWETALTTRDWGQTLAGFTYSADFSRWFTGSKRWSPIPIDGIQGVMVWIALVMWIFLVMLRFRSQPETIPSSYKRLCRGASGTTRQRSRGTISAARQSLPYRSFTSAHSRTRKINKTYQAEEHVPAVNQ